MAQEWEKKGNLIKKSKYHAHEWFENGLSNGDEQAFWQSLP